jgi:hypothetical protein
MTEEQITFEPGQYPETWLVRLGDRPMGAVGYAEGDGRWRAAWQGKLVGSSYETREEAANALVERRRREDLLSRGVEGGEFRGH